MELAARAAEAAEARRAVRAEHGKRQAVAGAPAEAAQARAGMAQAWQAWQAWQGPGVQFAMRMRVRARHAGERACNLSCSMRPRALAQTTSASARHGVKVLYWGLGHRHRPDRRARDGPETPYVCPP